jgi:hypothetical protein
MDEYDQIEARLLCPALSYAVLDVARALSQSGLLAPHTLLLSAGAHVVLFEWPAFGLNLRLTETTTGTVAHHLTQFDRRLPAERLASPIRVATRRDTSMQWLLTLLARSG